MLISLNQLLSNKRILLIPIALLVIFISGYLSVARPSKEKLLKRLNSQLREEKFGELYEDAGDMLHSNVTKEEFIRRMKVATAKLKSIDADLNFQRDEHWERFLESLRDNPSGLIRGVQTLEKNDKSVSVIYYWNSKAEFSGLSVSPTSGTSEDYNVYSVSAKHLYMGGKMIY